MIMTLTIRASLGERFARRSFESQVGKEIPVTLREYEGGPFIRELGTGRVLSAVVAVDGSDVTLTIEVAEA